MKEQGKRFNEGKPKYHLVPTSALRGLADVFTYGATKYDDWNWQKGLPWMEVKASLMRHLEAWTNCEDFDDESGLYHMDHVLANAAMLRDYYESNPQFDNRQHKYLSDVRIGLDVDGVLANFWKGVQKYIGLTEFPEATYWNFPYSYAHIWEDLKKDKSFWLELEPMCNPYLPFEPCCYITHREVPNEWTMEWLEKNHFPAAKVITTNGTKVDAIKELKVDKYVDDKYTNFVEINKKTDCVCYLMTRKYNERYDVGYRRINNLEELL